MDKYIHIGYFNNIDAVMLSGSSAKEIVENAQRLNSPFITVEDDEEYTEDELKNRFDTLETEDKDYIITLDVSDKFNNMPVDLVTENADDEFIDIYQRVINIF